MKHSILKISLILLVTALGAFGVQVSIYDVQHTEIAGDGTYPSPYVDQVVSTGGIVTSTDYSGGRFYISQSAGGPWSGIYIYDNNINPTIGDSITMTGLVAEYYGFTELKDISTHSVVSSGNSLPDPVVVTSGEAAAEEAFESVLVEVREGIVSDHYDEWSEWRLNDGSGDVIIGTGIFDISGSDFPLLNSYPFGLVRGVISYSWGEFRLHPRGLSDLQSGAGAFITSIPSIYAYDAQELIIPVQVTFLGLDQRIDDVEMTMNYDPSIARYEGYAVDGTLAAGNQITDNSSPGTVSLRYAGQAVFTESASIIDLRFTPIEVGTTTLSFSSMTINSESVDFTRPGEIVSYISGIPIADTLTVIQRPLLNIPSIVTPGDTLKVIAVAPGSTDGWMASLEYADHSITLEALSEEWNAVLERWLLQFKIPEPQIYELYDLHLTASGVDDVTNNSVRVIEKFKEDYSFIHISDTHLAGHLFYQDEGSAEDTSEMVDLREVIMDINIINPEFVLLTGDLINEGELEDFENRRNFTKAINLLNELEVPVYIVSGNHDLGGWSATPPSDGTARRNWWRFFGWDWLDNTTDQLGPFTQDYSFNYGPVHFIGLESYINYDGWRSHTYGNESFIPSQLTWLNDDLAKSITSEARVIFYHYDFSDDIDLRLLNIDMALWGHIHRSSGEISSPPYNLSTGSTSDGNRRYRVIRVRDSILKPEETVYATRPSDNLTLTFSSPNDGSVDSMHVIFENKHSLDFTAARVKIKMPVGDNGYRITGGSLDQVVTEDDMNICYINVDIPANSIQEVTVSVSGPSDIIGAINPTSWNLYPNHPNPFNPSTMIGYDVPEQTNVHLAIYSLDGRLIKTLYNDIKTSGHHFLTWDGTDNSGYEVSSGIYIYQMHAANYTQTRKLTFIK